MAQVTHDSSSPRAAGAQRYETEWEGLRLVVEDREDHFQVFVYDPERCEVIYTAPEASVEAAQIAAVDAAASRIFGENHDLNLGTISAMLVWDPY